MSRSLKNPYGLKDGRAILASDVPSGLECGCVCPACGHPLQAHKGEFKIDYFAHYQGADCEHGYQTALHILAKEILEREKRVLLPRLRVRASKKLWRPGTFVHWRDIIPAGRTLRFDEAILEKMIGGIVPDVLMRRGERRLMVEIAVTHGIDAAKLARIEELNISTLEFDFARYNRIVTPDDLKRELLFNKSKCARWAFHVDLKSAQEQADQEYTVEYLTPKIESQQQPKSGQKSVFSETDLFAEIQGRRAYPC
jgi:hypothetical protein